MEFTVTDIDELEEKLLDNGYSDSEIETVLNMYQDESDSETQTITVSPPK